MRSLGRLCLLLLVVTLLFAANMAARAQQDGGVTVTIRAGSKPETPPTLLVMCDLACNWKLDGEVKGHIDAGGAVKVKVESGQHLVEATTEDGADHLKLPSTVKPTGQTLVDIELGPIRNARLEAYRQARVQAEQEEQSEAVRRDNREREVKERAQQASERAAEEEAEREPWTDPSTGLMWTKKDMRAEKDADSDMAWQQAVDYCKGLRLASFTDWRLPSIEELNDIHVLGGLKGNLKPSGWAWSNTQVSGKKGKATGEAWALDPSSFGTGLYGVPLNGSGYIIDALCVRGLIHR
jgi:hypothetical protein